MDLFSTKMTVIRWSASCDTAEQLDLLELFIKKVIVPKFEKQIKNKKNQDDKSVLAFDLQTTKLELAEAILNRKLILAGSPPYHNEYPQPEKDISPHPENRMNELT